MAKLPCAASFLLLSATLLPAQGYGDGRDGVLAPTADLTLDTGPNGGVFQFAAIQIPAGVTVRLRGPNPARLLCLGPARIDGVLDADADGSHWLPGQFRESRSGGPGGFAGGDWLQQGFGPGGGSAGICLYPAIQGSGGSHASLGSTNPCTNPAPTYGTALPFDVQGGSGGGGPGSGNASSYGPPASGGGGAVVLLCGGPIEVTGRISARGGDIVLDWSYWPGRPGTGGNGSGGAILLRSLQCVRVSGTLDATGGATWLEGLPVSARGGDGFVRIDAYSACGTPQVATATIRPAATVTALPHLFALDQARVGQPYRVRCASAPGDVVGVYYSFGSGFTPVPPFGVVELDPTLILFLGQHAVPGTGDDPLAAIDLQIPNVPQIAGLVAHSQAFNAFGAVTGQARLSNRLVTVILP